MKIIIAALVLVSSISSAHAKSISKIKELPTPFAGSILYTPNDGKPHPGVVVLHGSEGGSLPYNRLEAQFLAAHGWPRYPPA